MKIKYQNKYTEIGRLSEDYDFLNRQLGNSSSLYEKTLFDFLKQLELRISNLIEEGNSDNIMSLTRIKFIQFNGEEIELNLNIHAHKRAYFLFTIYELGSQCFKNGDSLVIESP